LEAVVTVGSITREEIHSHADGLIAENGRRTAIACGSVVAAFALSMAAALPANAAWLSTVSRWDVFGAAVALGVTITVALIVLSFGKAVDPSASQGRQRGKATATPGSFLRLSALLAFGTLALIIFGGA
jgi:hypothetical protein